MVYHVFSVIATGGDDAMYARRYDGGANARSVGMTAALAINAGVIALLLTAGPPRFVAELPTTMWAEHIPLETPPPPPVEERTVERPAPLPAPERTAPRPVVDLLPIASDPIVAAKPDAFPPPAEPFATGSVGGGGTAAEPIAEPVAPAMIGAAIDPRFARAFQPDYPAAERRAGTEGVVRIRVLIGIDGRVVQVERIAAASDGLFEATRRQALGKWRFKPATRGDIPVESWKVMTVRFELSAA